MKRIKDPPATLSPHTHVYEPSHVNEAAAEGSSHTKRNLFVEFHHTTFNSNNYQTMKCDIFLPSTFISCGMNHNIKHFKSRKSEVEAEKQTETNFAHL